MTMNRAAAVVWVLLVLPFAMAATTQVTAVAAARNATKPASTAAISPTLRTQYGPKPTNATKPSPLPSSSSKTVAEQKKKSRRMTNDLVLGISLMAFPVLIVCTIHFCLICRKRKVKKKRQAEAPTPTHEPQYTDMASSILLPATAYSEYSSPPPPRRAKSKSVTWQSPFETKGRSSRHSPFSTQPMRTASDLHFVMIATPDKHHHHQQHHPTQAQTQTPPPGPPPHQARAPQGLPPRRRPFVFSSDHLGIHGIPQYRLDRLDSTSSCEDDVAEYGSPQRRSSLSLGYSGHSSPIPMLEDNGEYDSDSDASSRISVCSMISVSSLTSQDVELAAKLDEAMSWTQQDLPLAGGSSPRVLRASSSLNDFRHDLHHEHEYVANDQDEPENITRSSEYSF